jgi:pimeloyl-ACP methyl ester carboxylesterase
MLLRLFGLWTRLALRLRGVRRETWKAGGYDVRLYRHGEPDAEPWLLLHGLGSTALSWGSTIRSLHGSCRLWVPELSALGGTTGPTPGMNVCEATEVMAELLRRRCPGGQATICGISLGGWVAVRIALEHPELVARLVLIDCAGYQDQDWEAVEDLVRVRDLDDIDRLYRALFVRPPALLRWSKRGFLEAYTSATVRHIIDTLQEKDAFDDSDLARLHCPTGLVWGEHDGLFPLAVGRRMAAALPHAELEVVSDAAHGIHWESADRMNAAIAAFRRRHPLEGSCPRAT